MSGSVTILELQAAVIANSTDAIPIVQGVSSSPVTRYATPPQIVSAGFEGTIDVPLTISQTFTGDGSSGQFVYLQAFDNTQGGTVTGNSFSLRADVTSFGTPNNEWHSIGVNIIEAGGANLNTYVGTPVGIYSRVQKLSAPIGNTTVRTAVPVGGSNTLSVNDVTNFSWSYPNSAGTPISSGNPLPVKVGNTIYQCIGCASTSGTFYPTGYLGAVSETGVPALTNYNTDNYVKGGYQAGGYAGHGTLTFSSAVSQADGALGNSVVAQVQGDAIECMTLEMRDVSGLPSSLSGQPSVLEIDLGVSGPDDISGRRFISCFPNFVGGAGNPYTSAGFDCVLFANPASNDIYFNRGIWLNLGTILEHGIDLSGSQFGTAAHGLTLPVGADIAWLSGPSNEGGIRTASIQNYNQTVGGNTYSFVEILGQDIGTGFIACGISTRSVAVIGSSQTLAIGNVGCIIEQTGTTQFSTYLDPALDVPVGVGWTIFNATNIPQNIICAGTTDAITNLGTATILGSNEVAVVVSNGTANTYYVAARSNVGGSLPAALSANGTYDVSQPTLFFDLILPTGTVAPSGTPADGQIVFNPSTHKINVAAGGSWYSSVALTSGFG